MAAWGGLLRSHATMARAMNAELVAEHGITLSDYDVLIALANAPEHRMRRIDLANSVVLTASGITRLLDRLEAEGWVGKQHCKSDARVTWAVLTEAGHQKLLEAAQTHHADIARLFTDRLTAEELDALGCLLGRLGSRPEATTVVEPVTDISRAS
jgi:DNA-binding MarR family transcriptional regulator